MLVPTAEAVARLGARSLRWRWRLAGLTGRRAAMADEIVDPLYKPLLWERHGALVVASTGADIERLADIGRRTLELAGVQAGDVVADLQPMSADVASSQLALGCADAGVATVRLGDTAGPSDIVPFEPTVLVGRPTQLVRLLERVRADGVALSGVRVVIAAGEPVDEPMRQRLLAATATATTVVNAWAPPGVRARWAECHQGRGLHTWPDSELIEVVDPLTGGAVAPGVDGEIVWTGIGWRGTAILRLRTGVFGALQSGPCPACGRTTPRVEVIAREPPFAAVLDAADGVGAWQGELRTATGADELVVFLTPTGRVGLGPLLRRLDADLHVAQFVVLAPAAIARRLDAHGGRRVVDLR